MVMTLNAGAVKREDIFRVDPYEIHVEEKGRCRHFQPTDAEIIAKAEDLLDNGQIQSVEARRAGDKSLILTLGFSRTAAGRLIRHGFTDSKGKKRQDKNFTLLVKVFDCDDKTARLRNIISNAGILRTSDIDDAHNQAELREGGMTDQQIADLYKYPDTQKVVRLRRLLRLDEDTQRMIHEGVLSTQAAIDSLDVAPKKRAEIIKAATKPNGKVNGAVVRAEIRKDILNDDDKAKKKTAAPEAETKGTKPLSMKEVKALFIHRADKTQGYDPAIQQFCKDLLDVIAGKKGDTALDNAFNRLL